jgi:hypothetical protein
VVTWSTILVPVVKMTTGLIFTPGVRGAMPAPKMIAGELAALLPR